MIRLTNTWFSGNDEEGSTTYGLLGRVSTRSSASGGSFLSRLDAQFGRRLRALAAARGY
ncbi:MAG: hypothetical protein KF886_05720 [Candidatus Hydrogenedentes bacterium]|nr:hypothetical protein [Candidatus Hydrogenedentota bacterium]